MEKRGDGGASKGERNDVKCHFESWEHIIYDVDCRYIGICKMIYNGIIKSYLEYGILAWGFSSNSKMKTIRKLPKRCACSLALCKYATHSDPTFGLV